MIYNFTYCENYNSLFWGVIADSRSNITAIKDAIGTVIKTYVDTQTALVVPGVIPYKIETDEASLAGYFLLSAVPGAVSVISLQLRPAFVQFQEQINQNIATFVESGNWAFDTLNTN